MGWFRRTVRAVSKPVESVGRAVGDINVGKGLERAAGGKENLMYAVAAVAVVATAGAAAYGLPALAGGALLGEAAGTAALTGAAASEAAALTAGGAALYGEAAAAGAALTAATSVGEIAGGAIVGGAIGAGAGAATGSLVGDAGEGALRGAATGAAGGAASALAGAAMKDVVLPELDISKTADPRLASAATGAASGAASGAARAGVSGGDVGKSALLGGVTGGATGALFPTEYDPATGKPIKADLAEQVAKGVTSGGISYGLQTLAPDVFGTKSPSSVQPTGSMVGGGSPYATSSGASALAAGLRVGTPDYPSEGSGIPGEKKLEPQRPVWNISSLRTQEEAA